MKTISVHPITSQDIRINILCLIVNFLCTSEGEKCMFISSLYIPILIPIKIETENRAQKVNFKKKNLKRLKT